jgi:hypothetical protein
MVHWIVANRPTIYLLGYASLAGYWLTPPMPLDDVLQIRLLGALLSATVAIFAWGFVHLIEPASYSRRWARSKTFVIPLVWLALAVSLKLLFQHLFGDYWLDFGGTDTKRL